MPNPNAVVASVVGFDAPPDRPVSALLRERRQVAVELGDGTRARLDPGDPKSEGFAQLLDRLRTRRYPVYLEIDPTTSLITQLRIPRVARVANLQTDADGSLGVHLRFSHLRHRVPRDAADFAELERELRDALSTGRVVIVTEDFERNIIDVREFRPGPDGPLPPWPEPRPEPRPSWLRRLIKQVWTAIASSNWFLPVLWLNSLTPAQAQQIFDAMNATSCDPYTAPPPCIPFTYPEDGCWARAHEMYRLMLEMGYLPRKIWNAGALVVTSPNTPACGPLIWVFHVAPTLRVRGPQLLQTVHMVFDPSLFNTPVTKTVWQAKQSDETSILEETDGWVCWHHEDESLPDPNYEETNFQLWLHRSLLMERTLIYGPPPFACP